MTTFQTVLTHCRIVDGSGNPWFWGDLAVQEGRIARIAQPGTLRGAREIDVAGRFLTPGLIDIHTHSDLTLMINRRAESVVRQGVTTQMIGNCGLSVAPIDDAHLEAMRHYWGRLSDAPGVSWAWRTFDDYLTALSDGGAAINVAALAGHGALRITAMGFDERPPTSGELARMQALLAEAMDAGAFGLSTGLVYPPGCFAATAEIIALARVAARYGGFYASHVRGERETILEAVQEAIQIGRRAGLPVQISHNCPKWGAPCTARGNLALVEAARAEGLDVTVDNDVHTDLGPALLDALPQNLHALPPDEIRARLQDNEQRRQIKETIVGDQQPAFGPAGLLRHGCWERITVLRAPHTPEAEGQTILEIGRRQSQDPFDAYLDLVVANGDEAQGVFDYIEEENIRLLLQHPAMMISSDGAVSAPYGFLGEQPTYEPCSYGEFPGILERYVRDEPLLTLEEAIRKMTSFPAQRAQLWDRGLLRPGMWADLMVLDLERVRDRATCRFPHRFPNENFPHQYPEGIDYVLVNGELVISKGEHLGPLPGRVLRHGHQE